jgi:hypothetical protein
MYKKAVTQTSWILITIVLMIIAGTFFAGMMSGIPGLAGRLRGDLNRLLFAPFLTFWDQILSIIGGILNPIMGAVRFSIAMPIAFGAIMLAQSFMAGGVSRYLVSTLLNNGPKMFLKEIWGFIKNPGAYGSIGIKSLAGGLLKGAIYGAIVELVVSYGLNLLGVPQAIDNVVGGPVNFQTPFGEAQWSWGNAVSGAISGAAGGAVMGSIVPGIGTAIGAAIGGIIGFFMGGLFG